LEPGHALRGHRASRHRPDAPIAAELCGSPDRPGEVLARSAGPGDERGLPGRRDAGRSPLMRVLHVPSGNMFGGVERILETLAAHQDRCPAMQSAFVLSFDGRLAEVLREAGVPVALTGPVRGRRPWEVRRARLALTRVIAEQRPDVAVVHSSW